MEITQTFVEHNLGKRFNIVFSEDVEVVISRRRKTIRSMKNVGFFISCHGRLCYMDSRKKRRGYPVIELPTDKILKMEEVGKKEYSAIKNAKTILKKIHPNAWTELKAQMQNVIDGGKIEQDFEWHFMSNLVFVNIASKMASWERESTMKAIKNAFDNKTEYRWNKPSRGHQGRDISLSTQIGKDGTLRAYFSSEFPGCGNGHYYLLLNPTTAIYYEAD